MGTLGKLRDIVLILAGILIILFLLQSFGIPILPISFMPTSQPFDPQQALSAGNFHNARFSGQCVKATFGEQAFMEIAQGNRTFTDAEKEKLAPCLEEVSPDYANAPKETTPGLDYGITLIASNCTKGTFSVTIKNLPKTGAIPKEKLTFKINGWEVPCDGFPPSLAAGETATCAITGFVAQGYNELQIDAPELGTGTGTGIECR